jgi:DNA-binding response OmpR family regulator
MDRPLVGHLVLVVEDEPLIALDVAHGLETAGAKVIMARLLADALNKAEDPALSAAVLDHGLSDGDTSEVCTKLKDRDVPFVLYTGYAKLEGACSKGVQVEKPAPPDKLVSTLVDVLQRRSSSN